MPHTVSLSLSTDLDHGPQFNFMMELRPEHTDCISLAVIFLPAHSASFAHSFVSEMQSFYFSESQDEMV